MPKRLLTPFQKFIKIEGLSGNLLLPAKVGILIGSFISAIIGYTILRWTPKKALILNQESE